MHAAGVYHQHTRSDRNTYITVNQQNIQPSNTNQFDIPSGATVLGVAYSYRSIMHYSREVRIYVN